MIPRKPYVKKPLFNTEREMQVFSSITGYVIRTKLPDGSMREAETTSMRQCVAAIDLARASQCGIAVYAKGQCGAEEGIAQVDREWLMKQLEGER